MCTTGHDMEYPSLDPYEQKLFTVFDSYDFDNKGSLDKDGLTQLCSSLQLEEQGNELVQHLLHDPKNSRVTFGEFKEALLTLLGNVQNRTQGDIKDDKGSPDREVSPKYVYGTKKYGRRSRPKNEDQVTLEGLNENTNYTNKITYNTSVQRSNSQSDVLYSKKRKTNTKLKRCTSFPGSHDLDFHKMSGEVFVTNGFNSDQEFLCTEEMLRQAWEKLGVGDDGYLNQTELVLVCDAIGLHRLAKGVIRQLSDKLQLDVDHKISFQELLEALQQDDTWSEVLSPNSPTVVEDTLAISEESHFPGGDVKSVQHITLGPDGTGFINGDVVVELWENVGIASPKLLLQELGFGCSQIKVSELASALEKEIKTIHETSKPCFTNPRVVLLQAVLTLYRSEIRCLKNILEQMCAERDKLKHDVLEANNRATMLAQEVDDNHARMEQNTQQQVKLLEQRHADILKELASQFAGEKEQMSHRNQKLKQKIVHLESEEARLRNDLQSAQDYSVTVDKENQALNGRISELQQMKTTLSEQISILESDKHNYERENQQARIEPLLQQLSNLQIENSQLRDKNDEMMSEIESLNSQVCMLKNKGLNLSTFRLEESMEENVSIVCEGVGLGSKRRSDDSPSKDLNVLGLGDGSPRLGKVRKCHKTKSDNLEVPITSSESGFDTELDALDSSLSLSVNDSKEVCDLQTKVMRLEELLMQHGIPIPSPINCSLENSTVIELKVKQLTKRCTELQDLIISVQKDLSKMLTQSPGSCACECTTFAKVLNNRLTAVIFEKDNYVDYINDLVKNARGGEASKTIDNNLQDEIQKYIKENEDLVNKCSELERCVEELRNEYERCEDYWSSKLEEERLMFEQEQKQSSDKLTELIGKMAEYEAQFAVQDERDYRLPPIEETYSLEKQFTDLEQEFDEYKEHAEFQIAEKVNEIADLKEKLIELKQRNTLEMGVQVSSAECQGENCIENKMSNLSNCMIESTNIFSADTMPFGWSSAKPESEPNSIDYSPSQTHLIQRDYVNPAFLWNKNRQSNSPASFTTENVESNNATNQVWHNSPQTFSIVSLPSTSAESASTVTDNNSIPSRPKRSRKHNKNGKVQRLINKDDNKNMFPASVPNSSLRWKRNNAEEMVTLPIAALHNLNCRLHHLEQRRRHLQVVLRQQHYHAEQMLQNCWQQYRGEKAELQYMLKSSQEKLEYQMRVCNDQLERLTKTDILVKDLYVENSYLVANVQRLESQCHMLTQYNSASSSV
ncbi:hypothetical protein PPYR_11239 [Photinus pyralis]|uniref:EF-hand domain-containing protein n=2 Tax=Photinus pyralis TaxID=7054 RepID=A0A5N4AAP8_PHOPY|nr:hypothetical protein PPYR_11239 [Photinus pyralis]